MSYNVITLPPFERQAKRLLKKYPSLKSELRELVASLKEHPDQGAPLGNNCYKVSLSIASKGKGKSGGARVITYFYIDKTTVILLNVYDKSEQANITSKELALLLKQI